MGYKKHLMLCFFYLWAVIRDSSSNGLKTPFHNIYKQIDLNTNKESECICLENDPSLPTMPQLLDPNKEGLQRLMIFLYKDSIGNIQLYIPGAHKQAIIPDLQIEPSDISTQVTNNVAFVSLFTYVDRVINIHPSKTNGGNVKEDEVKWIKDHDDTQLLTDFPLTETTTHASDEAVPHYPYPEDPYELGSGEQPYENSLNYNELQPIPVDSGDSSDDFHHKASCCIIYPPNDDNQENSHAVYSYPPNFLGGQDLDSSGKQTFSDDLSPGIDLNQAIKQTLENDHAPKMNFDSEHVMDGNQPPDMDLVPMSEQNVNNSQSPYTELDPPSETLDYVLSDTDSDPESEETIDNVQSPHIDFDYPSEETIDHAQSGIGLDPESEQTLDYAQSSINLDPVSEQNFEQGHPPDFDLPGEGTFDNSQPPSKDLDTQSKQTVDDAQPLDADFGPSLLEEYDDESFDNHGVKPISEETTPGSTEETKPMITDLTFSQWFATQMKNMETKNSFINRPLDIYSIKMLIQKSLMEHGFYISSEGKLTDSKGRIINMSHLHIRPLLIGETVEYDKLVASQYTNFKLPKNLQYFESLLITLLNPPKIIGIIPMGKLYLPTTPSQATILQQNDKSEYPKLQNYYGDNIVKYTSPIKTKSKRIQISLIKKSPENKHIEGHQSYNFIDTYLNRAQNFSKEPVANENKFILGADKKNYNQISSQHIDHSLLDSEYSLRSIRQKTKRVGKHTPSETYRTSEPQPLRRGYERSHKNSMAPEEETTTDKEKVLNLLKLLKHKIKIPKQEGEEVLDDHDLRIIGGAAATGSGSPLSSRGRSGLHG